MTDGNSVQQGVMNTKIVDDDKVPRSVQHYSTRWKRTQAAVFEARTAQSE